MQRGDSSAVDVSVIIPTFRREREIVEAIGSALDQEDVTVDVLVLDDSPEGSARAAVTAITDPRVRYRRREIPSGGKPAVVRNEGAALARGRYLYFLDDDDQALPGALRAMVRALEADRRVGVAVGKVVPFGTDASVLRTNQVWAGRAARSAARTSGSRWLAAASLLFSSSMLVNSACLLRREHFSALGGYDPEVPLYEDVEFYARAIRRFGHVFVDHPVLYRRTGAGSLTQDTLGDATPIEACYRVMHQKYKGEYGVWEYRMLRLFAKAWCRP